MQRPLGIVEAGAQTVLGRRAAPFAGYTDGRRQQAQRRGRGLHRHRHQRVADRRGLAEQGLAQGLDALVDRRQVGQQLTVDLDAIAQGVDPRLRALQLGIHLDAPPDCDPGRLGQAQIGPQANGGEHQVGLQTLPIGEGQAIALLDRLDTLQGVLQMPAHTQFAQGRL